MAEDILGGGSSSSSGGEGIFGGGSSAPAKPSDAQVSAAIKGSSSGGGFGGFAHELQMAVPNAVLGLGKFVGGVGSDIAHNVEHAYDVRHQGFGAETKALLFPKESPTEIGLRNSFERTGSDVIHPTHFSQAYAHGHLLSKLVEDLANASIVGGVVAKPLAASASAAEEAASTAESAASDAADQATEHETAHQEARTAAQGSADPILNARVLQAEETARLSAERVSSLSDTAQEARARADRIGQMSERIAKAQKLTGTAANPIELAGKAVKGLVGAGVDAAAGLDEEGRFGPVARAGQAAQNLGTRISESAAARLQLRQQQFEQTRELTPLVNAGADRASALREAGDLAPAAETASTLGHLDLRAAGGVGVYQRLLADDPTGAAAEQFLHADAEKLGVDPEHLRLAYEAAEPSLATPEHAGALDAAERAAHIYEDRQLAPTEAGFLAMRGEADPSPELAAYRRWQVEGTTAEPARRAILTEAVEKGSKLQKDLRNLDEQYQRATGRRLLTPEQLKDPVGTYKAVLSQSTDDAREIVAGAARGDEHARALLSAEAEDGNRVAQRILDGKLAGPKAVQQLADRLATTEIAGQPRRSAFGPTITSAEQLGEGRNTTVSRALPERVDTAAARLAGSGLEAGVAAGRVEGEVSRVGRQIGVVTRQLARLADTTGRKLAAAEADIDNAPARYRGLLHAGVNAASTLDELAAQAPDEATAALFRGAKTEAITSLAQAVEQNLNPRFVQGGELPESGFRQSPQLGLPDARRTGARDFKSGEHQPITVADQTQLIVKRAKIISDNEAASHLQNALGSNAATVLGDEGRGLVGKTLAKAMAGRDYVPWNPASPFDRYPDSQVTGATQFIPKNVFDVFRNRYKEFSPDNLESTLFRGTVKANDLAVKGFKTGALYLSPRWIVGHVIGHSILSTFGAGLNPAQWVDGLSLARKIIKGTITDDELDRLDPQVRSMLSEGRNAPGELVGRGQAGVDAPTLARLTPGDTGGGFHPIRWSQHAVAFTDDLNRVAIAIAKAKEGLTPAEADAFRSAHPELGDIPHEQLVNEYAIRESLKAQGDYTNLTTVEREVLGRLVLFYPWIKHMTKLTFDLAVHHPLRVAWALHLADLYGPHGQTPITSGKPPLGNKWYEILPKTDPFSHVFSNFGATGAGETPLAALNPAIDTAGALFNLDVGKHQLLQHPAGFGPTDQYGRPSAGLIGWKGFGNFLAGEQPQLSAATQVIPSLLGHAPVARYPTGEAYRVGHQDIADPTRFAPFSGGGSFSPLLSLFGIPYASKIDEAAIVKRVQARKAELEKERESYARLLPGRAP